MNTYILFQAYVQTHKHTQVRILPYMDKYIRIITHTLTHMCTYKQTNKHKHTHTHAEIYIYIYIYIYVLIYAHLYRRIHICHLLRVCVCLRVFQSIGIMVGVSVNGTRNSGPIPGRFVPKTQKLYLMLSYLILSIIKCRFRISIYIYIYTWNTSCTTLNKMMKLNTLINTPI